MDNEKRLYKSIASKDYASANEALKSSLEVKSIERIKQVLHNQEEE